MRLCALLGHVGLSENHKKDVNSFLCFCFYLVTEGAYGDAYGDAYTVAYAYAVAVAAAGVFLM